MNRFEMVRMLLGEQEEADRQYLTNEIDQEKWLGLLQSIDQRLSIVGLRLASRPWTKTERASVGNF